MLMLISYHVYFSKLFCLQVSFVFMTVEFELFASS